MTPEPVPLSPDRQALVDQAARWLADQPTPPHPLIPVLISEFEISIQEACAAARAAHSYRTFRQAFA
jgi:hypothetical protein